MAICFTQLLKHNRLSEAVKTALDLDPTIPWKRDHREHEALYGSRRQDPTPVEVDLNSDVTVTTESFDT